MKFGVMTREQILNEVMKAVPEYLERIKPDGVFNRQVCIEMAVGKLQSLFKSNHVIEPQDRMKVRDIKELDIIVGHFVPFIIEGVTMAEMQHRKEQMESEINKARAEAVLAPAFEEAGFEVEVNCFKYTASISVRLFQKEWAQFQVRYEDILDECSLSNLVSAVVDLKDAAIRIGSKLYVGNK